MAALLVYVIYLNLQIVEQLILISFFHAFITFSIQNLNLRLLVIFWFFDVEAL